MGLATAATVFATEDSSVTKESDTKKTESAVIPTMVIYNSDNLPNLKELQQEIYNNNFSSIFKT